MVKYYCNKCGAEIKSDLFKVVTANSANEKKNYHLCEKCTKEFVEFMKMAKPKASTLDVIGGSREILNTSNVKGATGKTSSVKEGVSKEIAPEVKSVDVDPVVEDTKSNSDILNDSNEVSAPIEKKTVRRPSKYLTEYNRQYIQDHRKDMSLSDIARELRIPYQNVYQFVRSLDKQDQNKKEERVVEMSVSDMGRCIALNRAGWSIKDIANEVGKSEEDVMYVLADD